MEITAQYIVWFRQITVNKGIVIFLLWATLYTTLFILMYCNLVAIITIALGNQTQKFLEPSFLHTERPPGVRFARYDKLKLFSIQTERCQYIF